MPKVAKRQTVLHKGSHRGAIATQFDARRHWTGGVTGESAILDVEMLSDLYDDSPENITPEYTGGAANRQGLADGGFLYHAISGEPRFWGIRRVENEIGGGMDDMIVAGAATITDQGSGVNRITGITGGADGGYYLPFLGDDTVGRKTLCFSCEVKAVEAADVGKTIILGIQHLTNGTLDSSFITPGLTTSWKRYALYIDGTDGNDTVQALLIGIAAQATQVDTRRWQVETVAYNTTDAPGEYVDPDVDYFGNGGCTGVRHFQSENGNTFNASDSTVVDGVGADLSVFPTGNMKGLLLEPARTALMPSNFDEWDDATWQAGVQNGTLTHRGGVGPDRQLSAGAYRGDGTTSQHQISRSSSINHSTGATVAWQCVFRHIGGDRPVNGDRFSCRWTGASHSIYLNTAGTSIVSTGAGTGLTELDYGLDNLGNGWKRVWGIVDIDGATITDTSINLLWLFGNSSSVNCSTSEGIDVYFFCAEENMFITTPADGDRTADVRVEYDGVGALVPNPAAVSMETYVFRWLNTTAFDGSGGNHYVNYSEAAAGGLAAYINLNTRQTIAYDGSVSTSTGSLTILGFAEYAAVLRLRHTYNHDSNGYHYIGQVGYDGTTEEIDWDLSPAASKADGMTIGNVRICGTNAMPHIVSRTKIWPVAQLEEWATESLQ